MNKETVEINGKVYTFRTTVANGDEILICADVEGTRANVQKVADELIVARKAIE